MGVNLQSLCLAIITGTPLLAACFVGLRVYARRWSGVRLGWNDYLIVLATALSITLIYPSWRYVKLQHLGIHIWEINQRELEPDFNELHQVVLFFNLVHNCILPLVKASILLLLLNAGWVIVPVRRAIYCLLGFIFLAWLGPWIALIFQCPPRTGATSAPYVFNHLSCINYYEAGKVNVFIVSVNMLTDLLIFPIPIILLRGLQKVSLRARLTIMFLFAISLGATAIAAARLYCSYQVVLYHTDIADYTIKIGYSLMHAENNTAIIIACIPPLRNWIISWRKKEDEEVPLPGQTEIRDKRIPGESLLAQTVRVEDPLERDENAAWRERVIEEIEERGRQKSESTSDWTETKEPRDEG